MVCVSEDGARPFYATTPVSVKLPERSDGADLVPMSLCTNFFHTPIPLPKGHRMAGSETSYKVQSRANSFGRWRLTRLSPGQWRACAESADLAQEKPLAMGDLNKRRCAPDRNTAKPSELSNQRMVHWDQRLLYRGVIRSWSVKSSNNSCLESH